MILAGRREEQLILGRPRFDAADGADRASSIAFAFFLHSSGQTTQNWLPYVHREEVAEVEHPLMELGVGGRSPWALPGSRRDRSPVRARAARAVRRHEEHRGADERDQEFGANRDRQPSDGADERIVDAAQWPSLVGDGHSPLVRRCVGHGFARLELGRAADKVRDQPLPVDPRDVRIAGRDRVHNPGLGIHEVALEVQRPTVSVHR